MQFSQPSEMQIVKQMQKRLCNLFTLIFDCWLWLSSEKILSQFAYHLKWHRSELLFLYMYCMFITNTYFRYPYDKYNTLTGPCRVTLYFLYPIAFRAYNMYKKAEKVGQNLDDRAKRDFFCFFDVV